MARAQSTVVGKALEAGILVLFVTLLTTLLFGGAIPAYRASAGQAVADRTLASAAQHIQQAVPPAGQTVRATVRVELPATIAGAAYEIAVHEGDLVLSHPRPDVRSTAPLALPGSVARVDGTWRSGEATVVRIRTGDTGLVVRLTMEDPS